jgi:hypothetical protein
MASFRHTRSHSPLRRKKPGLLRGFLTCSFDFDVNNLFVITNTLDEIYGHRPPHDANTNETNIHVFSRFVIKARLPSLKIE